MEVGLGVRVAVLRKQGMAEVGLGDPWAAQCLPCVTAQLPPEPTLPLQPRCAPHWELTCLTTQQHPETILGTPPQGALPTLHFLHLPLYWFSSYGPLCSHRACGCTNA